MKKSKNEVKFKMFVSKNNLPNIRASISYVDQSDSYSKIKGLTHYAKLKELSVKGNAYWLEITVSRTFLIFLIGKKYGNNQIFN